jgi:hypothetical protein
MIPPNAEASAQASGGFFLLACPPLAGVAKPEGLSPAGGGGLIQSVSS